VQHGRYEVANWTTKWESSAKAFAKEVIFPKVESFSGDNEKSNRPSVRSYKARHERGGRGDSNLLETGTMYGKVRRSLA
jgi:hypothetical protein